MQSQKVEALEGRRRVGLVIMFASAVERPELMALIGGALILLAVLGSQLAALARKPH